MKKTIAIFLILAMIFSFAACGNEESSPSGDEVETRTIQIAVTAAADENDPYYIVATQIQKYVEENGDGSLKIEVYPNGTLGGENEVFEGMQMGTADMGILNNSAATNYIPECGLLDLPFVLPDYATAKQIFSGELKDMLLGMYDGSGVKSLGLAIGGFRIPGTVDTPLTSPEDFKGLKMRCVENKIYSATYEAFGANPVPMAYSEVLTALQQGTIDGTDQGASIYWTNGFADIIKHIAVTNQFCAVLSVDISESLWSELTPEQQALLSTAAQEGCSIALEKQETNDAEKLQLLEENGVEIVYADELDLNSFKSLLDDVYATYIDEFGSEKYDKLVKEVSKITGVE